MSPDRPPSLPEALGIPGARSVSLFDPDGPRVLWWTGADEPGEQRAAAVVALASAATALAGPVDELGDVILTSAEAFHVIRLVGDGTGHVAHLTLGRPGANLAMARRDFRLVVAGYAGRPRHAAEPLRVPPREAVQVPAQEAVRVPPQEAVRVPPQEAVRVPREATQVPPREAPGRAAPDRSARLPRRERGGPPRTADEFADLPPDWFTSLIRAPFADDEGVLDRILVTLRTL